MNRENEVLFYTASHMPLEENGIYLCALNQLDGSMRIINHMAGIEHCSYLTLNQAEDRLYAVSEKGEGEVYVYAIDKETCELHLLDRKSTEGADPCYLSLTPDGQYLLVVNYSGGSVNVFEVLENGSLGEMTALIKHEGSSVHESRQEGPHPHSIIAEDSGSYAIVSDLGLDEVIMYRVEEGKLVTHQEIKLPEGSGPRLLAFHPTKKWVYGINELNNTITTYTYSEREDSGELTILTHTSSLPKEFQEENTAAHLTVSPCGRFLYASNRGNNSIALYEIEESSGALTAVEWVSTFGKTPRHFSVMPGGYLLAANQDSNNIVSFHIEPDTGRLTQSGHVLEIPRPMCIQPMNSTCGD